MRPARRQLRTESTPAEIALWALIKGRRLAGRRFRRQHSIGSYVLDFYCPSERLAIELDGAAHFTASGREQDLARDAWLQERGIRVLRFENRTVIQQPATVLLAIASRFRRSPAGKEMSPSDEGDSPSAARAGGVRPGPR
jgi:very-short-patch-repair endonuclease